MAVMAVLLVACGNNGQQSNAVATSSSVSAAPAVASKVVTESEHKRFEQIYTERCIKAQSPAEGSQMEGGQAVIQQCECIARTISARLSKADAVHFINRNEFPFDLVMMTEQASNTCYSAQH
ncbi:MAG: hypothetical protein RIQ52_937 [Pseudomonadota bacterium]|jgi:hypothetical protein